jgi:hypothetical protein
VASAALFLFIRNKLQCFGYIDMIILNESVTDQDIYFIPREYAADVLTLTDEQTGEVFTYNITPLRSDYYLIATDTFDTLEGHTYKLTVYNGSDVVYKDKVFCTNQSTSTYSVNNGEYVQNSSNNDFIIYE